jgi:DNA repair exonuclease SbcCD ATPase subunit
VNQLAEAAPKRLDALADAGRAVREATQEALQGRRANLARHSSAHARLVDELTGRAMEILTGAGGGDTPESRSRLWSLLRTASLDPDAVTQLAEGALAAEPKSGGFDDLAGFGAPALSVVEGTADRRRQASGAAATRAGRGQDRRQRTAERQAAEQRARLRERTAELQRRLEAARQAAQRLSELRAELAQAEREERRLVSEADAADRAVDALRAELAQPGD